MNSIPTLTSQAVNKLPGEDHIRHSFVFPVQTRKNTTCSDLASAGQSQYLMRRKPRMQPPNFQTLASHTANPQSCRPFN